MALKRYHILVADDSRSVRAFFEEVFAKRENYKAEFAASGEEAVEIFKKSLSGELKPFDFVLSDISMPGLDGFETLEIIRKMSPDVKTGMITGFNIDDYIKMALEKGVFNIICKMDSAAEIIRTVDNLITGENILGIENYLEPGTRIKRLKVTETDQLRTAVQSILDFAEDILDEEKQYGLKTGLVEMGTNAIYHAYGYEKGSRVALKEGEEVFLNYGADKNQLVVMIEDTNGSLTKEKVLLQLNKCVNPTQEDLIASGGRGIYLTRYLCDKLIINLEKNKRTEMILIMNLNKDYKENKPLLINQF